MGAISDHSRLDIAQHRPVQIDKAGRNGVTFDHRLITIERDRVSVLTHDYLRDQQLLGDLSVRSQVPVLPVNRDEGTRLHHVYEGAQLVLASMP